MREPLSAPVRRGTTQVISVLSLNSFFDLLYEKDNIYLELEYMYKYLKSETRNLTVLKIN